MRIRALAFSSLALVLCTQPVLAAEGDLDPSFGTGGSVTTPVPGVPDGSGVVLQDDGKIVSAVIDDDGLKFFRHDASGILDPAFGVGGVVTTPAPGGYLAELARQPDGKLLVVAGTSSLVIARYDAGGVPDPGFGTGGVAAVPDCGSTNHSMTDLAIASDGRLVVAFTAGGPGDTHACVVRFDAAGAPDPTFGVGGVVALDDWAVHALALQGDELLVGGGVVVDESTAIAAVMRLNPGGDADAGFGDGGVFSHALTTPIVTALRLDVAGDIVVLGRDAQVMRLDANGTLDESFGTDGVVSIPVPPDPSDVAAEGLAVQRDGRILVGASFQTWMGPPVGFVSQVGLVRYDVDGSADATFGSGGIAASVGGRLGGFVLQPDGKPVLSATIDPSVFSPTEGYLQVARHLGFTLPCPASAASGCRASIAPKAGKLRMDAPNAKAKLQWSWQKGAATDVGDFGDPLGGDDYVLCLYDESAGSTLASGAIVPGGGTCKGKPCWKSLGGKGFAYKDPKRLRFGIAGITLKAGVAGKAKVSIKGQGVTSPVPDLPAPLPLRVQLFAENGACFESVFSSTGTTRNDGTRYQGKSD